MFFSVFFRFSNCKTRALEIQMFGFDSSPRQTGSWCPLLVLQKHENTKDKTMCHTKKKKVKHTHILAKLSTGQTNMVSPMISPMASRFLMSSVGLYEPV